MLRHQPANRVAADRLLFELSQGWVSLPVAGPLEHARLVWSVRFSPDGTRVVSASLDGAARVWDARTGRPVTGPLRHPKQKDVRAAEFSPDGTRVLTGSGDGTARIWDAANGTLLQELPHGAMVLVVRFSPDGKLAVTSGGEKSGSNTAEDRSVKIWHVATGQLVAGPFVNDSHVRSVEFSPDGRTLLLATGDGSIQLRDLNSHELAVPPLKLPGFVSGAQFSPDGSPLAFGGTYELVTMVNIGNGRQRSIPIPRIAERRTVRLSPDGTRLAVTASGEGVIQALELGRPDHPIVSFHHRSAVYSTAFSPDSQRVVSAGYDETAQIWDPQSGRRMNTPLRAQGPIYDAVFSRDGRFAATAPADQSAWVWATDTLPAMKITLPHPGVVNGARVSPDGSLFATVTGNGLVQAWQFPAEKLWESSLNATSSTATVAFSPNSDRLAASVGSALRVWETASGRTVATLNLGTNLVHSTQFDTRGGRLLVAASGRAQGWDLATGNRVGPEYNLDATVGRAALSPDDSRIVLYGSGKRDGLLVAADEMRLVGSSWLHANYVGWVEFSPDGRLLATASADKTAAVWNAATGEKLVTLSHGAWVICARFSPDGRRVVTAAQNGDARIWETETGRLLTPSLNHQRDVVWAEFSADGRRVVTASKDRTARVWDSATGLPLTSPLVHDREVTMAAFSHSGEEILTVSKDTAGRIWFVPQAPLPSPAWLADLAEAVGGLRVGTGHGMEFVPAEEVIRLRERLTPDAGDDFYGRWVRWFFADRATRPLAFELE